MKPSTSKEITAKHLQPGQQPVTSLRSYVLRNLVLWAPLHRSLDRINSQAARLLSR